MENSRRDVFVLLTILCLFSGTGLLAQQVVITPGENLVVEGIPPIPASLVETVGRYSDFRSAAFAGWHPIRREILIRTRFADVAQIHHVKFPGGDRRQLTFYPEPIRAASFQPGNGDYMMFAKDIGGNEFFQGYLYDLKTGNVSMFTDGKSRNTSMLWSHKGDRVVYSSTRRNGRDVDFIIEDPHDPATTRTLAELSGGGWAAMDWSSDDTKILAIEFLSINDTNIWLFDVASGGKTLLTPKNGQAISYSGAQFGKDNNEIYVTTDRDSEFQRLAHVDIKTGKHTFLTDHIKWDVDEFDVSPDRKMVAFVTNEEGISKLHLLITATRKESLVRGIPVGLVGNIQWHENGKDLGFELDSARSTFDVYSVDVKTGKVDRWTASETGGLNTDSFSEPSLIKWKSFDNLTITGFLYMPPKEKFPGKRPVMMVIHGGPEGQARPGFLGRYNYFLNELGVALIFPNVRGSSGFGKSFLKLDNGFLREGSYKDIGTLLDWVRTQPELDSDRILVTGGSYGGHMSFAVASLYSDKIRAALPVVGISNLVSFLEHTEAYRRDLRRVEYGDERDPKMREFLERIAPLNNADKIRVPLFVVQGGNDPRVPLSEAEQMVAKVRANGTPVWYLMAKDEGHGFSKKKNVDFQFLATVMFVKEYLLR